MSEIKPVQIKEMDMKLWSEFKKYCKTHDYTIPAMIAKLLKKEMKSKQLRRDRKK